MTHHRPKIIARFFAEVDRFLSSDHPAHSGPAWLLQALLATDQALDASLLGTIERFRGRPATSRKRAPDLVGTAGLRPLEDLGLEIFYSLVPGSWGQGYATEAARAVLDHALGPLGLPEVLAEVLAEVKTAETA
jgi:RimJ/RimL family protein N-acetyltransferase